MKFRAIFVLVALVTSQVPISAAETPKAGSACSKIGRIVISGGKAYTCKKFKKSSKWSIGIRISPQVPSVTPKPTPTSEPSNPIRPLPTTSISPTPTPTRPSIPLSLDSLDPQWTTRIAYRNVLDSVKPFDSSELNIRYIIGPKVSSEMAAEEKLRIDRIAGLWSTYFLPKKVRFIYVSPEDGDWANDLVGKENLQGMIPGYTNLRLLIERNQCGFALGSKLDDTYTNIQCLNPNSTSIQNRQTGPHEYTHFAQYHSASMPNLAACWVVEGMATFYGVAIGFYEIDSKGELRTNFYRNFARSYGQQTGDTTGFFNITKWLSEGNTEEIIRIMQLLEVPGCSQNTGPTTVQIGYLMGSMAFEALVAVYGHQGVVNFMTDYTKTKDWRVSFKNTYGLEPEDFYRKLTPYIASQVTWS